MRAAWGVDWRGIGQSVKDSVSTRQLCEALGLRVDSYGFTLCPFHTDQKGRSLKVYDDPRRGWHCFGCGCGGTVIDFAMKWYGCSFTESVRKIDSLFALGLPIDRRQTEEELRLSALKSVQIAKEREAEEQSIKDAESVYWACFDRFLACVQTLDRYKPKPGAEVDLRWAYAVQVLPEIKYEYEIAQDALCQRKEGRKKTDAVAKLQAGRNDQVIHG